MTTRAGDWAIKTMGGETVRAFLPASLPPTPYIGLSGLQIRLEEATGALGRLDGVATVLPGAPLFRYMYVRKEALLSSQIEGTQSSLNDLLAHEDDDLPGVQIDDVTEVQKPACSNQYETPSSPNFSPANSPSPPPKSSQPTSCEHHQPHRDLPDRGRSASDRDAAGLGHLVAFAGTTRRAVRQGREHDRQAHRQRLQGWRAGPRGN